MTVVMPREQRVEGPEVGHAVYQVRVVSFAAGGGGVALNRRRRLRTLASEWIN